MVVHRQKNADSIFPGGEAPLAFRSEIETWQFAEDHIHSATVLNRIALRPQGSRVRAAVTVVRDSCNPMTFKTENFKNENQSQKL